MDNQLTYSYTVNGREKTFSFAPKDSLLKVLRDNGYSEVHNGCETGECGSCVVIMDGVTVNSCMVLAASARDKEIMTVKALGDVHNPHPIQRAFAESGAVQCGFCTPGQILSAYVLLTQKPAPSDDEIKQALDGNICRCTGYKKIVEAVKLSAVKMQGDDYE